MSSDKPKKQPSKAGSSADILDEDILEQRLNELAQKTEESLKPKGAAVRGEEEDASIDVHPVTDDDPWAS